MWEYSGPEDKMRLSDAALSDAELAEVLKILLGKGDPPELSAELAPLYNLPSDAREAIRTALPTFDRWGLLREGEVSRKENPLQCGLVAESEEDTAETAGSAQGTAVRARRSKKRPVSAGSRTTGVDEEETESADTPPPADSP